MGKTFTFLTVVGALGSFQIVQAQSILKALTPDAPVAYLTATDPVSYTFQYSPPTTEYLTRFREMYGLEAVVAQETSDLGRAKALCQWVHNRLEHDGHQQFTSTDAFAILHAAMLGQQVQCVEYGRVLATAFNALGMPARPLYLKSARVQTKASAAGHALTEVWIPDLGKWIMADSQADIIPTLNGKPLNAVELQQALSLNENGLDIITSSATKGKSYFRWLQKYLYYFDTMMDNRYDVKSARTGLMLVPVGAHKPVIFQRVSTIHNMRYTHSAATFYASPTDAPWLVNGTAAK